jgi:protein ImuB
MKAEDAVSALSRLPVETLRLPKEVVDRLQTLGLGTIGDVLSLPRESLAARFGVILPRRLDQLLGLRPESFTSERLIEPLCAVRDWELPIDDRMSLVALCRQMIRELLSMAKRHSMGLHELEGELQTEGGPVTMAIRLMKPSSDIGHLEKLLELQFERQAWSGGVTSVRWAALRLGPIERVQECWFENDARAEKSHSLSALVDRLSSRLGASAVLRAEVLPDAQPERVSRLVPWTDMESSKAEPFLLPPELSRGRPLRLLVNPEPIDVSSIVPDGPPIHVVWEGRSHPVMRAWGPERIATGWWRGPDVERDYFRAEWDDGAHAWIYHDRRADHWFLHGFFD